MIINKADKQAKKESRITHNNPYGPLGAASMSI